MEAKGQGIKVSLEVMNALKPELFSGVAQDCLLLKNTALTFPVRHWKIVQETLLTRGIWSANKNINTTHKGTALVVHMVKNLSTMRETGV